MPRVCLTFERELGFCLSRPECLDSGLLFLLDEFVVRLPGTMFVVEAVPFAKVFNITIATRICRVALTDNTLDSLVRLEFLFFAFLFEENGFTVFTREIRCR